ncbi:hypothetical protein LOAG_07264 [Loa loa]|uniref:Geminin n=1 Tax=Loa loa TaxID=7209 RepID=A0A1I7VAA3_LOALO|nr:hypothetical protein LOAG_07264 [Loa loa]EFO21222.1 hypothetical protein LOAG_07264 [Loa loa]
MPGGTLCQVQNISTHTTRETGELKVLKTTTANANVQPDGNKQRETKTGNQNVKRNLLDTEGKLDETKVLKAELLHHKPNTIEAAVQTDVIVDIKLPKLTAEDLRSPEVSANYWRRLAERLYTENEREAKLNFELSIRLAKLNEEIMEEEEDYLALKNYISTEGNIEYFSGSEFNRNEEAERDADKNGDHVPENYIPL